MPALEPPDGYALGRSDAETQRLILQHQIYGPLSRQFLVSAGITAGMRVLDVGSGAGDMALLAAELTGPEGRVVGVDPNPQIVEVAAARVAAVGWTNVEFHACAMSELNANDFDAVVGRWVLMYIPDPADGLRTFASRLRPGGVVAFQEGVFTGLQSPYPAGPLHERVSRWMAPPPRAPGPDAQMGFKLFETFLAAGLPAPRLRMDIPVGGGNGWPGYEYLVATLRSLLPFLEQLGVVTADEVEIDTLADRLRDEVVERNGVQFLAPLIGAFARAIR